jgi:hypothetical protein
MRYSLTYNGNAHTGGTIPTDTSSPYTAGATVTVKANSGSLTKTNSIFAGWNTQANGLGTSYAPSSSFVINANTILYAQWNPVTVNVTATTPYTKNPGDSIAFTYTPTTSTGTAECQLLNFDKTIALTSYAATNPIASTVSTTPGTYSYYIRCRNTTYTSVIADSNLIIVTVNSVSAI